MMAIILTAGYGNRMKPLTLHRHKTLLSVAGKEIITRIIEGVVANGIRRIIVGTGYRADEVEGFLTTHFPEIEFTFVRNERFGETNNIYSMALAFESIEIDDDVLLIESDLICDADIFTRVIKSPHRNVALVDRYRTGMDGTVVQIRDNVITHVIPPHQQDAKFDFHDKFKTLNIYKFDRAFCATTFKRLLLYYAKTIDANCYYELVLGILIYMQQDTIHAEIVDELKWAEVDDPNDLRAAEFVFNNAARFKIIDGCFGGFWNYDVLDFGFIRNMYFPTASMLSEIRNSLAPLLHSYSSTHEILREKLALFLQCQKAPLNVLSGGCQAFPILGDFLALTRTHIPAPTFGEYRRVCRNYVEYREDAEDLITGLDAKIADGDAVVFVNPNNPTGRTIDGEPIYDFARRHPKNLVIVDESFADFARITTVQEQLERAPLPNVVIIKSLSKNLGVPGVRLGYTYSFNERFNAAVAHALPIWQINSIAEFLLEICLKRRRDYANSVTFTLRDREAMKQQLEALELVDVVRSSGANFLLVRFRCDPSGLQAICHGLIREHSIYVKNVTNKMDDGHAYLRLAVRLPAENERLCAALAALGATMSVTVP